MEIKKQKFTLNNSGVVLTTVMIVLLVMTIIISAVVFLTVGNLKKSTQRSDHIETYYVAEGGINYLTKLVEDKYAYSKTHSANSQSTFFSSMDSVTTLYPESSKVTVSFSDNGGKTSYAEVWVTLLSGGAESIHRYQLNSKGYIGSALRTLSKIIKIDYAAGGVTFNDAILAVGSIEIGGAEIQGTIKTTLTDTPSITFRGGTVEGIYIPTGTMPTSIVESSNYNNSIPGLGTAGIYPQTSPTVNPIVMLPVPTETTKLKPKIFKVGNKSYTVVDSSGNFVITSSTDTTVPTVYNIGDENPGKSIFYVPNFKVSALAPNFILEVNRDITIVSDTLWLNNKLIVTGTGKLTIFVKPYASTSTSTTNTRLLINSSSIVGNQSDSTKMVIYANTLTYTNKKVVYPVTLTFVSGTYFFNFISENLDIDLKDSVLRGALATNGKNVFIGPSSSSSAILLYAPSATVTMKSSSSSFYGAIVAEKFVSSTGNSHPLIVYDPEVNTYIPVDVIDLSGMSSAPTTTFFKNPTIE